MIASGWIGLARRRDAGRGAAALSAPHAAFAQAKAPDWPTERPPRPLAAKSVKFPPYEMRTLPNGLRIVIVQHHEQPSVTVRLLIRAGASSDPKDKPGVATLAAALLDQGTTTRSASQIADQIDYVGGALATGAGTDLSFINAVVMKDSFDLALNLLSDITRNPAFSPEELDRQREQMLSGLKVSYEDPDYVAEAVVDRLIYGFHPYGRPATGTPASVASITRDDLLAFHRTYFAPNNCILAVVGDLADGRSHRRRDARVRRLAEEGRAPAARGGGRSARADAPRGGGRSSERRADRDSRRPARDPAQSSRLSAAERDDQHSRRRRRQPPAGRAAPRARPDLRRLGRHEHLQARRAAIIADTDTRTETTAEALRVVVDEFARLQRERVGDGELSGAQAYLAGNFPLTIETPDAIAMQVLNALFYDLDLKELETYRERVTAITPDDIQRVAQQYLKPARLSIVLVGDASKFVKDLKGVGFDEVELVSLTDLDLTTVNFRRPRASDGESVRRARHYAPAADGSHHDLVRRGVRRSLRRRARRGGCAAPSPACASFGFGGERLAAAGADLIGDYRGHTVTGLVEVDRASAGHLSVYRRQLVAAARERRPDVFVAIDFPDFNFRLGQAIHALGIPVVYYISPQLWAWRPGRLRTMKAFVDRVLPIFPFEEKVYRDAGIPVEFVGHPLIDLATAHGRSRDVPARARAACRMRRRWRCCRAAGRTSCARSCRI